MSEIIATMDGFAPEPVGDILAELGEFNPGSMAGLVPEPQGSMSGTVASNGDRTPFVAIQEPALAGFKYITKGPGYLIAGAGEDSQKVVLIDATGFRSLRIESESVKLDGKIRALDSSADYIFAYVVDDAVSIRRLYVLQNQSGLAIEYIFDLDYDEISAWTKVNEDAGLVAYPVGVGRIEFRRITAPFEVLSSVQGIGRSAVAHWFNFPAVKRPDIPDPPLGPQDHQNLWNFGSLLGLSQNYTGSETITDNGPEAIDLDFGFAAPMRVTVGASSMPDGDGGAAFSTRFIVPQPAYFERPSIDFAADGGLSIFGYVDPVDARRNFNDSYNILAQGPSATGLRLFKFIDYNGGTPIYEIKFQTSFDSGMETLTYLTSARELMSICITQTPTRAELWINGVLEDFVEPIGATAITIPNGNLFTLGGAEFGGSTDFDMHGILGQYWRRFNRALSSSEIADLITATNINTNEVGMLADYYYSNTSQAWDYSPNGKTWTMTSRPSPTGSGGTAFVDNTSGRKLEFQMLIGGAPPNAGMSIGFRTNSVSGSVGSPSVLLNLTYVDGAGNVFGGGGFLGNIGAYGPGDLVSCRVDLSTSPATYEYRINNGSWNAYMINMFGPFVDYYLLMYAAQTLTNMTGTMQLLATEAEMAALGNTISAGYSEFPSVGG